MPPKEAPKYGLFGKGVYFADMVGKSAGYTSYGCSNNIGLFLACEVALGQPRPLYNPNVDADELPKGAHSTRCIGK